MYLQLIVNQRFSPYYWWGALLYKSSKKQKIPRDRRTNWGITCWPNSPFFTRGLHRKYIKSIIWKCYIWSAHMWFFSINLIILFTKFHIHKCKTVQYTFFPPVLIKQIEIYISTISPSNNRKAVKTYNACNFSRFY